MVKIGNFDLNQWAKNVKSGWQSDSQKAEREVPYAYVSDKNTRFAFEQAKPVEMVVEAAVKFFQSLGRNELLGNAVKVGPKQFTRVHKIASECSETLGIEIPTLYIVNKPTLNAATYGTETDSFVLIHSALVDHLTDEELKSVIGHECGHIHNKHVVYLTALHFLTQMASIYIRWTVVPATMALTAWSRRAEVSGDRAGLLCSKNLDVSTRALTKLALGSTKLYEELNVEAFLDQYEEGKKGPGKFLEYFASHPWLPKRVMAIRCFAESKLYLNHLALDREGLSMDQVDNKVHDIIKVWNSSI